MRIMRLRPRTIIALISMVVFSAIGGTTAYALSEHPSTSPPASSQAVSAACQQATNKQDAYAQYADQHGYFTTYTNAEQFAADQIDGVLVSNMVKAGCPDYVRFYNMTTGEWDN
jgi:hypothetical protein